MHLLFNMANEDEIADYGHSSSDEEVQRRPTATTPYAKRVKDVINENGGLSMRKVSRPSEQVATPSAAAALAHERQQHLTDITGACNLLETLVNPAQAIPPLDQKENAWKFVTRLRDEMEEYAQAWTQKLFAKNAESALSVHSICEDILEKLDSEEQNIVAKCVKAREKQINEEMEAVARRFEHVKATLAAKNVDPKQFPERLLDYDRVVEVNRNLEKQVSQLKTQEGDKKAHELLVQENKKLKEQTQLLKEKCRTAAQDLQAVKSEHAETQTQLKTETAEKVRLEGVVNQMREFLGQSLK